MSELLMKYNNEELKKLQKVDIKYTFQFGKTGNINLIINQ